MRFLDSWIMPRRSPSTGESAWRCSQKRQQQARHGLSRQRARKRNDLDLGRTSSAEADLERGRTTTSAVAQVRRLPRYKPEEKLEWLRLAWVDVGQPFTQPAYNAWRDQKLKRAAERGEFLRIPSVSTIYALFGGWGLACNTALPGRSAASDEAS